MESLIGLTKKHTDNPPKITNARTMAVILSAETLFSIIILLIIINKSFT